MTLYTVAEVAEILRVSDSQVYAFINAGKLRCYRLTTKKHGGIRVSDAQLEEFLRDMESGRVEARPKGFRHIDRIGG
ncbi:MAG TPA: helix-turn-helix domain-containing protein [Gemmataceae bacterium]|nr:helix-turn-helix domain-containing protein [Gemmataceae bacterium]